MALENIANENTYTVDVKGVNDFMELTYSLELNSHVINNEKMKNRYERKIIKAAQEHIADSLLSYNRIMGLVDEAIICTQIVSNSGNMCKHIFVVIS